MQPNTPDRPEVALADRQIGSIRRECLDHVAWKAHLRRILAGYAVYYNELRTHLSLGKEIASRAHSMTVS